MPFTEIIIENVTFKNAILLKKNSFIKLNNGIYNAELTNFMASNYFTIFGVITNDFSISLDHTLCTNLYLNYNY